MDPTTSHIPASKSQVIRDGIIRAMMNRECEDTITNTGRIRGLPAPAGIRTSGNHRSHCAWSPGFVTDPISRIRRGVLRPDPGHVLPNHAGDPDQPTRSANTVAGIRGVSASSVRIAGSTALVPEP